MIGMEHVLPSIKYLSLEVLITNIRRDRIVFPAPQSPPLRHNHLPAPQSSHLRHSEHLSVAVLDGHTQQRLRPVARASVDLLVKARVLPRREGKIGQRFWLKRGSYQKLKERKVNDVG